MTPGAYVLDTHTFIWQIEDSPKLSPTARGLLDRIDEGDLVGIVPSIVLVEMIYLVEKYRIPTAALDLALEVFENGSSNYQMLSLGMAVTRGLRQIPRSTVPDMPDRIIAATALAMNLPLLSRDTSISALDVIEVVW